MSAPPPAATAETPQRAALLRFVIYCVVGGTGVLVDSAIFVPLVHFGLLDARLAVVPAYLISSVYGYWLNHRWTFADVPVHGHARPFLLFIAVGIAGAGVRIGVMHVLMVWVAWGHPPAVYLASFIGIVVGTGVNFAGARLLVFPTPTATADTR